MSRNFSIYLDAIRFLASVIVLLSHIGYARYSGGEMQWIRDLNLGSDAVILFFVLSGFVIAYSALGNRHSGLSYTKARMARLYSVVIPALVVTVLCDFVGRQINPAAYAGTWFNGENLGQQILAAVTFTTNAGDNLIRVGTNGPFWSVAYEAWYYAAFGVAVFLRGRVRIALLLLICTFAGVSILLLAPCWLIGVGLYLRMPKYEGGSISTEKAIILAIMPWLIYVICLAVDLPLTLTKITFILFGAEQTPNAMFAFSDEFLWNYILAILFASHFFGMYHLAKKDISISPKLVKAIRWVAGATFSIYLFHYPVLTLMHALPGYDSTRALHYLGAGVVTLIICFLLAEISERRLGAWKKLIDQIFVVFSQSVRKRIA